MQTIIKNIFVSTSTISNLQNSFMYKNNYLIYVNSLKSYLATADLSF